MRLSDFLLATLLSAFAVGVIAYAWDFPLMPGQAFGPALFPTLVAAGLILASIGLVASRLRSGQREPLVEHDGWVRNPRLLFDFVLAIGGLLFYILFSETLGYLVAAPLALAAFLVATGVRARVLVPVAVVVPLVIHYIFYSVLKVPLPWGLLTDHAW